MHKGNCSKNCIRFGFYDLFSALHFCSQVSKNWTVSKRPDFGSRCELFYLYTKKYLYFLEPFYSIKANIFVWFVKLRWIHWPGKRISDFEYACIFQAKNVFCLKNHPLIIPQLMNDYCNTWNRQNAWNNIPQETLNWGG